MGCSSSKLDDEEAVQLCKDRKQFIKQAVEQRTRFASGHLAYIQSLKRVSAALRDYFEVDEPRQFMLDSFVTPPFTPVKKASPGFISISPKSFSPAKIKGAPNSPVKIHYSRTGGNQAVSVEERPRSPETRRVEAYSPMHHHSSADGFFFMQASPVSSTFPSYYANNTPIIPPPSPQTSQWDSFWNPFSSLDYYGYPTRSSLDQMVVDDDIRGLRRVREEEGIPELEDETEQEEMNSQPNVGQERVEIIDTDSEEGVVVEDVDEDEDDDTDASGCECECERVIQELNSHNGRKMEVSRAKNEGRVEVKNKEMAVGEGGEGKSGTPGFTVYVNRRPTSLAEVIKDLEDQFIVICNSAKEVSSLLESERVQYLSGPNDLTAMKMLNPVALFRSASSRSSSSRYLSSSSTLKDEEDESSSDFSEESCISSGSHQSTLDRLYAWEKKLYEEVRSGETVRRAYEKKCAQLRSQDVNGEDPSAVDKTRATIRDLHTQIKVSIHSVEAISKRIETLRDEELQPQLFGLVQGLARMWKVMAESHQIQKRAIDEAKLMLAGTSSKLSKRNSYMPNADPQRLARSASNLETELRNWRACYDAWITSQRSYVHALSGWLLRCIRCDPDASKLPLSPRRSSGTFPVFGLCLQWSKFLDAVNEKPVLDGIDFFAAGMGYVNANQLRDDSQRIPSRKFGTDGTDTSAEPGGNTELVEYSQAEEVMTVEKMAELSARILWAGMSVAVSSLTEFAIRSAEGYNELIDQWGIANVSS